MSSLLEEVLRKVAQLPQEEQDAIAVQILDTLEDEQAWERQFGRDPGRLRALAQAALEEDERGQTRPLDELL